MSTTSGGADNSSAHMQQQDTSVTTVYNGDRTMVTGQKASPPSSSYADSGVDNSNTESSAGDAKLIIDVPDFSRGMETPRAGIDNPSFETDKTDIPKPIANGHNGTVNLENGKHEKDKMAEAVNLELINMKPFAKSVNGKGNGVPAKKKETSVNMNDTYDDYFIPVNEHKKYIRGGEKLYVTKDKRDMNQSKKPFMCWVFGLVLLAAAVIIAILASTGVIFSNEAVESHGFADNEKIAGFGGHHSHFSSVSPSPDMGSSTPSSPPTTDMSGLYLPRTVEGQIVIDNMEFTPGMANKSSTEFEELASSIETELKKVLFNEQSLIGAFDAVRVKVYEFSSGSVVAKYRIGMEENNEDSIAQDLLDAENLKNRLDSYLRNSNGYLYNYRVPIHRLRSDRVIDRCKVDNGKCSHYCMYSYVNLDFECYCPSDLVLKANKKDCESIAANGAMIDDVDIYGEHDLNSESETNPELDSEIGVKPEPEPSSEPNVIAEPEPSSEPEGKAEPEPEVKAEPEPSSEPEVKAEPEPSSEPEVKAEPETSSEPEVKAEPEPSSEPEVKAEPEPSSEPEVKSEPEPSSEPEVKAEPEPSSEPEVKSEPEPSSEPEVKAEPEPEVKSEPEPSSEPEVKAEPQPSSEPEVKAEPEPSSEPKVKAEPEPSSEPEVKSEPEPSSEPEVKSEPEPNSEPETKPEPVVKPDLEPTPEPETKPEPSTVPISKASTTDSYDSLSDVELSSELDSAEQNSKSVSSSTEISAMDQSDREAKSHSDEVFSHEIKPEMTYSVSTESDIETKTESVSEKDSKSKESTGASLGDVILNSSEESTTLPAIAEDWLTTTVSSAQSIPKLPSDLEVTEKENSAMEEETKTEPNTLMGVIPVEIASKNSTSIDMMPGSSSESSSERMTERPDKLVSDSAEDMSGMMTTAKTEASASTKEDTMGSSTKENENVSKENVTEFAEMTTMPPVVEQESIKKLNSSVDSNTTEKTHVDDLSSLEKTNIPDPTKKLQSLVSLEEPITNTPNSDALSTSTQSNIDSLNENGSVDEQDTLDHIMSHVSEQNVADVENDDEKTSALDLYQKPESKKKEKKTSKNPDIYLTDAGFTKRNKTKTEKENKKNSKPDLADVMPELMTLSKCEEGQFQCVNSTTKDGSYCIQMSSRCDAIKDCMDNSDEYNCAENACAGNFQCKSGECLQRNLVCNNIMDCEDGSDEQSCNLWKCAEDEKQCTSGQCVPASYFCDGKSDCSDHVDELQCNSPCNGYQCSNGYCISNALRCNGVNDCSGGEDEQNCECKPDEFKCKTGSECIPKSQVCDNVAQCVDRSDEWRCIQLDGTQLVAKKNGETTMKVCNENWSDQWSDFVCKSLGFTETKSTNFRPNESNETAVSYLRLKDGSTATTDDSLKSLTAYLEESAASCSDTVEIKCSYKNLCGDFGGKDPFSMEMWPSVVYLYNTRTHKSCTSSLVKNNWLLSSYSCVHSVDASMSADQWEAVSSKTRVANESSLTKRSVSRIISHPGVKYEKLRYLNDTVLIELSAPYELSNELNTICLPEKPVDNTQPCVTVGWSYESPGVFKQFSRSLSDPLMSMEVCNSTKHFNGFLVEREICVAPGELESSNMEIGSPLMCLAENGLWQLQGTLSYRGGHGRLSKPSIYNPVLDAVPWAENTVTTGP